LLNPVVIFVSNRKTGAPAFRVNPVTALGKLTSLLPGAAARCGQSAPRPVHVAMTQKTVRSLNTMNTGNALFMGDEKGVGGKLKMAHRHPWLKYFRTED
jgi:hypothetical protein